MINKEKIILYLDNQMSSEEREKFELELSNSNQLREELEKYKHLQSEFKSIKYPEDTEDYYNSLLPRFREKQDIRKNKKYISILSLGFSSVVVLLIAFLLFFNKDGAESVIFEQELSNETASELINNYSESIELIEIPEAEMESAALMLDSLIVEELDLSQVGNDSFLYSYAGELTNIVETISDDEADYIYGRIINKQFFGNKQ